MYVNLIIMLYTLNLYSAVCQLYLNKTEKKKVTVLLMVINKYGKIINFSSLSYKIYGKV